MNSKGFTMNSYYCISVFCGLNVLGLFQSCFKKAERFFYFLGWALIKRLANYLMAWAWVYSDTAWPLMMSHLRWAYIVVQTMLLKKIQKFIVNSSCFLTFWINCFWQRCKNWRSLCSYWQQEEKKWWSNSVVTREQFRWKFDGFKCTNVTTWNGSWEYFWDSFMPTKETAACLVCNQLISHF